MESHAVQQTPKIPVSLASEPASNPLVKAGAFAGPLWIAVAAVQAATRDGFDFARHPISVLSNGDLGWIQIASVMIAGLLLIGGGRGLRQTATGRRSRWTPRLITLIGVGMIASGVFVADPLDGFPQGTPPGRPDELSVHGGLHYLFSSISFALLVATAFISARHAAAAGARRFARYTRGTAIAFIIGWPRSCRTRKPTPPTSCSPRSSEPSWPGRRCSALVPRAARDLSPPSRRERRAPPRAAPRVAPGARKRA